MRVAVVPFVRFCDAARMAKNMRPLRRVGRSAQLDKFVFRFSRGRRPMAERRFEKVANTTAYHSASAFCLSERGPLRDSDAFVSRRTITLHYYIRTYYDTVQVVF